MKVPQGSGSQGVRGLTAVSLHTPKFKEVLKRHQVARGCTLLSAYPQNQPQWCKVGGKAPLVISSCPEGREAPQLSSTTFPGWS